MSRHDKHHEGWHPPSLVENGKASGRLDDFLYERHVAEVSLMINKRAGIKARATISTGGLLSIAAIVSTILLSTAVLVHVATT